MSELGDKKMIFSKTVKLLIVITVLAVLMQTVSAYTSVTYAKDGTYMQYTNTKSGDYSCFYGGCTTGSRGVYDNVIVGKENPHTYYYQPGTSYYYPSGGSNYYSYGATHYTSPTYYYPSYGYYYYPAPVYNYYYYAPYTWRYGYYPYP
ncbi:MAG: hypothetical protein V1672_04475 [Candidatus Diapherotrites archaeon]